jgi:DNA polymerase III subunit epsilon
MKTLFLDTETTGLHPPKDKMVEVAIADIDGNILLDTLVNPEREIGFATTIHYITDDMVSEAPTAEQLWPRIREIVSGNQLVIYNAQFDIRFFPDNLECANDISCAMIRFAKIYGDKHPYYGDYKWQKLTTAADHIGYEWEGDSHRALADVFATCALWKWMEAL